MPNQISKRAILGCIGFAVFLAPSLVLGSPNNATPTCQANKQTENTGSKPVPTTFPARNRAPFKAEKLIPRMLPKRGSCPPNYAASGTYCRPTKGARFAVRRVGPCPLGYGSVGMYCIAQGWQARYAFVKALICATGYKEYGKYCIKERHAGHAKP